MTYEEVPTLKVFSYILADAFDESEATTLKEWLGDGKTLAELAGEELSREFYDTRGEDVALIEHMWGLIEITMEMNDGSPYEIVVSTRGHGVLLFSYGDPNGTAWLSTTYFARDREAVKSRS